MPGSFRNGLYAGLLIAAILWLWLATLWQPERQIRLHSEHLLTQIENKNWRAVDDFVAEDYQDRWGNDHSRALGRVRQVFSHLPKARIAASGVQVRSEDRQGYWQARITVTGDTGELATLIKERVNSLSAPFELEWQRRSKKPWDWKLVSVRNPSLEIADHGL